MLPFKQFDDEKVEVLDEALTMQQRLAKKRAFARIKHKVALGRKKAMRKTASADVLQKRARKSARAMIMKKLSKNVAVADLSFAQRQNLEKRLDKMKPKIDRIAKKLVPKMRKREMARKSGKKAEV